LFQQILLKTKENGFFPAGGLPETEENGFSFRRRPAKKSRKWIFATGGTP